MTLNYNSFKIKVFEFDFSLSIHFVLRESSRQCIFCLSVTLSLPIGMSVCLSVCASLGSLSVSLKFESFPVSGSQFLCVFCSLCES